MRRKMRKKKKKKKKKKSPWYDTPRTHKDPP